ncbi:alpha/beta hydrolase [Leptospira yasudae]|uniref:Alpha/beta hydrolase n=1 Tax=Leptospira yasudae TaxID=2202201 RepID=A0A6N4QWV1_9LEPT|nr:alpha/beta hydrolase [Leptospira yasudae]TGL75888.1 alpha/beta hydrolase [Leptospira yasudae]TGL81627.1 alpha/beta hydrolase [Leptospira yasudae]TGL88487.1 alpha/beta hydrolase [Leptospira yasudae]
MKKIISAFRTFLYFLSEILEFIVSVISSLFPTGTDPNLARGDIYIVTGYLSGTLFYSKLRRALEAKGYQPRILRIPPFFWSTKKAVEILAKQMDQIPSKSILIAHNTGGLLTLLLPDRSRQKIRGLITLGTPFRGSHLFTILPGMGLRYGSPYLKELFKTFLFMDRFHPLAPLKEFIFLPASSSIYGEERDLWFDIPGNYNQVRKAENIRTILEYLVFHYPSAAAIEAEKNALLNEAKKKVVLSSSRPVSSLKEKQSPSPALQGKNSSEKSKNVPQSKGKPTVKPASKSSNKVKATKTTSKSKVSKPINSAKTKRAVPATKNKTKAAPKKKKR